MPQIKNSKQYDLEDRTYKFAKHCRDYVRRLPKTVSNFEYGKQLVRSSGSIAANDIEANESLSKKDCLMRIKICRKEAKESKLWINLTEPQENYVVEQQALIQEADELMRIFGSIIEKLK